MDKFNFYNKIPEPITDIIFTENANYNIKHFIFKRLFIWTKHNILKKIKYLRYNPYPLIHMITYKKPLERHLDTIVKILKIRNNLYSRIIHDIHGKPYSKLTDIDTIIKEYIETKCIYDVNIHWRKT
jgi:hypothetical protein